MQELLEEAHFYAEKEDMEQALDRYNIVGRQWSNDNDKEPLWLANLAGFEYKAGNPARALRHVLNFGKKYPESQHITKVIDLAFHLGKGFLTSEDEDFNVLFREAKAIKAFEFLQKHDPYSKDAAEGQYSIGIIKMKKWQWEEAIVHLKDVLRKQPGTNISAKAEVAVGECYLGMNKGANYDSKLLMLAERYLKGYLNNYPNGFDRQKATDLLAQVNMRRGDHLLASARYYCTARKWKAAMSVLQNLLEQNHLKSHHLQAEELVSYVAKRL